MLIALLDDGIDLRRCPGILMPTRSICITTLYRIRSSSGNTGTAVPACAAG